MTRRGPRAAGLGLVIAAACTHAQPAAPPRISSAVRADLDRAEDAERKRRHDIARVEYERAVADAHDPDSLALARHEFAETLGTWGEYDAMIAQLEGAVAAKPDDAAAWHDLGLMYFKVRHDAARAATALERSAQLAPRDPRPHVALAQIYWCNGDRARATAEYRALLALDLPERTRAKVRWALDRLADPAAAPLACS